MSAYTPTPVEPSTIDLWETTTLALGGLSGPMNTPIKTLANQIAWLKDRVLTLSSASVLPLRALPEPTIHTASNKVTVIPAAATAGGTVTVAAGTAIALSEVVETSKSGRLGSYLTPAFTSDDMAINSTYYLRGQVTDGELVLYTQKGADTDAVPSTFVGTPNGSSGGGFDSTPADILLAKIVTTAAESEPTVTNLANATQLHFSGTMTGADPTRVSDGSYLWSGAVTLNWARTPKTAVIPRAHGSNPSTPALVQGGLYYSRVITITRLNVSLSYRADWDRDLVVDEMTADVLAVA
jgi:hypothetical protein